MPKKPITVEIVEEGDNRILRKVYADGTEGAQAKASSATTVLVLGFEHRSKEILLTFSAATQPHIGTFRSLWPLMLVWLRSDDGQAMDRQGHQRSQTSG